MFTQKDLTEMNEYCIGLKEIVEKNNRDCNRLIDHGVWKEYLYELRSNAIEAEKILKRYVKLIDELKLDALYNFKKT